MTKENPYNNFSNYILRTSLLPFSLYKSSTASGVISDDDFKKICNDPIFKEAIYLASPSLFTQIGKWLNNEINDIQKQEKLKYSILKYFSRMSSRCTPFGLFAGCSVGKFGDETNIKLKGANQNKRHTRLDMNYLVALSQNLVKKDNIRKQLFFFPNSSIYKVGNKLRYIEYKYINNNRKYQIVAVEALDFLEAILLKAKEGTLLSELANILAEDDDITIEEANSFIEELVSNQLLVSELEPSVSGPEFLEQIFSVLKKLEYTDDILIVLSEAEQKISCIDKAIGNDSIKYQNIIKHLEKIETDFEHKYMFQTDMFLHHDENTIDKKIINDIKKGFTLLNKISRPLESTLLTKFKEDFHQRFEGREVPLSTALDVELGIGYNQDQSTGDINPLIDDLIISGRRTKNTVVDVKWTPLDAIFQNKLIHAYKENAYTITLLDQDFKDYEVNWDDLPDTVSSIIEIVEENGKQKIKYNGGGGSSAANLLGRFCHGNKKLYDYTKQIIDVEKNINKNKILAEIVHLPEYRVGNILMRPDFREYEIPYLAKSIKEEDYKLPLDDLMISMNNNKIVLRSKKHNKEVIPYLTNAHNYSKNSLPIYHFLADLQTQNIRSSIGFRFAPFVRDYDFLPRVEYNNLIIHDATWNLKKTQIESLLKQKNNNDENLFSAVSALRKQLKIPQYVLLVDGDNKLLVNFENLTSVRMFLDTVKKRSNFKLTEFLFNKNCIVKEESNYYTNQIIISFYNEVKLNKSKTKRND